MIDQLKRPALLLMAVFVMGSFVTAEGGVNRRERRQQGRILQGAGSGELTNREFFRLEREQARIARHETRARSDGEFTRRERARLQRELNHANRHIFRQKHDQQDK